MMMISAGVIVEEQRRTASEAVTCRLFPVPV